jgi:ABC-type anion transport system duplicated permease subunit
MKQVTQSLNDSVPYGKFYLPLTFMKNLQFRFYKKIRMVLVPVQVPQKK